MKMQRIVFTPAAGQVRSIPIEETKHYEENPDGTLRKLRPLVRKYKIVPDLSERTMLRVYRDDMMDFVSALQWRTGQSEINISTQPYEINEQGNSVPARLERDGDCVLVPVFGTFQPELDENAIHEICEDYRLLYGHFPNFLSIFTIKTAENKFATEVMEWLISSVQMLHASNIQANLKPLPAWIARVLELRKGR
jgi:hypothetical protein